PGRWRSRRRRGCSEPPSHRLIRCPAPPAGSLQTSRSRLRPPPRPPTRAGRPTDGDHLSPDPRLHRVRPSLLDGAARCTAWRTDRPLRPLHRRGGRDRLPLQLRTAHIRGTCGDPAGETIRTSGTAGAGRDRRPNGQRRYAGTQRSRDSATGPGPETITCALTSTPRENSQRNPSSLTSTPTAP